VYYLGWKARAVEKTGGKEERKEKSQNNGIFQGVSWAQTMRVPLYILGNY
jgi:hypothetical protein